MGIPDNYQNKLINLLDEVRAIAGTGLNFTENPFDKEHYKRLLEIVNVELSQLANIGEVELNERFSREIGYLTPKIGVNAAIFDEQERILLEKRSDDSTWGLPSGWVEVGETLLEAIVREVGEETGLVVRPLYLIRVYETKAYAPERPHNAVGILYLCESVRGDLRLSHESLEIGYYDIETVSNWHVIHKKLACDALNFLKNPAPFSAIKVD